MVKSCLILFFLSCSLFKTEIKERPSAPDVKPAIDILTKDSGVKKETREQVIKTLTSCQEYANASNERFDRLEAEIGALRVEISSKDLKIKELEEELSTWRKLKSYFWFAVMGIVGYFFLRLLWINRTVIMRLAGIPIP